MDIVLDVRGYGHVKEKNYQQYQLRLTQQLKRYKGGVSIAIGISIGISIELANVA